MRTVSVSISDVQKQDQDSQRHRKVDPLQSSQRTTAFQVRCIQQCDETLRETGVGDRFDFRFAGGAKEIYYVARLKVGDHDLAIYVYEDEAQFAADGGRGDWRFEKWDYKSGDQLIEALATKLRDVIGSWRSPLAGPCR